MIQDYIAQNKLLMDEWSWEIYCDIKSIKNEMYTLIISRG